MEITLQVVMLVVLTGLAIFGRAAVEQAASRGVDGWFESHRWRTQLSREMKRFRGAERQQLRFLSYGGLWSKTRLSPRSDAIASSLAMPAG